MSDLRDELARTLGSVGYDMSNGARCLHPLVTADAILPIIARETELARLGWTAEHHRAALQLVTEMDRGLRLVDMEVRITSGSTPSSDMPLVRTVGDLTTRHQLTRPHIRVAVREVNLKIVKPSDMHPGTVTLYATPPTTTEETTHE